MKTTIISHIYNEEFLLPMWIKFHKNKFDEGIIVDYNSTDNSLKIIKNMAPSWRIIQSRNSHFSAKEVDEELMEIEKSISGRRIILTSTEFFIGNTKFSGCDFTVVPSIELVCGLGEIDMDLERPFHEQIFFGLPADMRNPFRWSRGNPKGRLFHNGLDILQKNPVEYTLGRHYEVVNESPFLIYRVQDCLVDEEMIDRQLQIQLRISNKDVSQNLGFNHHNEGRFLTRDTILARNKILKSLSIDLREKIHQAVIFEANCV